MSHAPVAGAKASVTARGLQTPACGSLPGQVLLTVHCSPPSAQLHRIHRPARVSSRMSRYGSPRGGALLWTLRVDGGREASSQPTEPCFCLWLWGMPAHSSLLHKAQGSVGPRHLFNRQLASWDGSPGGRPWDTLRVSQLFGR